MANEVGVPVMVGGNALEGIPPTQVDMTNHQRGRRMVRSVKNPLDKCTIVSIYPDSIEEVKPTIELGKWIVPGGSMENPGILVVTGHTWWKDYDPTQPILEITVGSIQIAESIIKDYCNGMLGCNMADAMPGFFFVIGEQTKSEILIKYKQKLQETFQKQQNWYKILVKLADSLWSRTNGNPLAIWEQMKVAALALNLNDKAWLKDHQVSELIRCSACGSLRNPAYPICPTCKSIDQSHPGAKELKFAV